MKQIKRGSFIVIEGIDGSGTTTQAGRLAASMREDGYRVLCTCQPSELEIGSLTRSFLSKSTREVDPKVIALLFAADRMDHLESTIKPWLSAEPNSIVICDRYVWSSLAYQTLHSPMEWIRELNRFAIEPDLTVWISVPPEEARRRVTARAEVTKTPAEIYDDLQIQTKIHQRYEALFNATASDYFVRIDGLQPPDVVEREILNAVLFTRQWPRR